MVLYTLSTQPFYDQIQQCYRKIVTINTEPAAPLKTLTKRIHPPKLSPFQQQSVCCPQPNCIYVILNPNNLHEYLCVNDIPNLFSYLVTNGYTIDTNITKMMNESEVKMDNKLLCFISK
jgi:hypothetical protein